MAEITIDRIRYYQDGSGNLVPIVQVDETAISAERTINGVRYSVDGSGNLALIVQVDEA